MENLIFVRESFGGFEWLVIIECVLLLILGVLWGRRCCAVRQRVKDVVKLPEEGVSVIITSHNSAEHLKKNLPYFLNQDYDNFEVVVVDECSEDDTEDVLACLQKRFPHLRCTRIYPDTKFRFTKKLAINIGVLAAKHDILLFSEANCHPVSRDWIRKMQESFDEQTAVVLGFANYKSSGEVSNRFRMFRVWRFLDMLVFAKHKNVLGDGCNLAYRKRYYLKNRGFAKDSQSYLGYDNDMVRDLSKYGQLHVAKDLSTYVSVEENNGCKGDMNEILYYYAYKLKLPLWKRLSMDIYSLVRLFFYGVGGFLIWKGVFPFYVMAFLSFVLVVEILILNLCMRRLKQDKLFIASCLMMTIGFIYRWGINVYVLFNRKKWK